ncbi:MAG: riboflavin synthase [Pseudomonadota bacterium]|nr:riboflavin synthase [Pseudomonadota bacterium]
MFTGIITDVGAVTAVERRGDVRFFIRTAFDLQAVSLGASIACSGVCLTVVEKKGEVFAVDVSAETLSKTTVGSWAAGTPVNLERSLKLGDELGGHLVYGHVDGVGEVVSVKSEGDSQRWTFRIPEPLARFVASKGSIALNGVSLTVNEVQGATFGVNLIPHTLTHTTFGTMKPGDPVNVEVDMLARYVARLNEVRG